MPNNIKHSSTSDKLIIDAVISINGTKNEDFRDVLTDDEIFKLNKLIAKLHYYDIEITVEYIKLKKPLLI